MPSRILLAILTLSLALQPLLATRVTGDSENYIKEVEKWRLDRVKRLTSPDGWLSLVGLFWLDEGENKFGADENLPIVFPKGKAPAYAGSFFLEKGKVRLKPAAGVSITTGGKPALETALKSDVKGDPTLLTLGSLTFHVVERGEKFGIRVKDSQSSALKKFAGIENYPVQAKWRLTARFEKYDPPKKIAIHNIVGITTQENVPGALVFKIDGKTYRLDPIIQAGSDELFILFSDKTSGKETYGAGRYLYSKMPGNDGNVVVDFNKAYNPPCAFTAYATCPLPPPQNKLPFRVEAGEKNFHMSH